MRGPCLDITTLAITLVNVRSHQNLKVKFLHMLKFLNPTFALKTVPDGIMLKPAN